MFGLLWFLAFAGVAIVIWRFRVADKKAREEMKRKYPDRNNEN